MTTRVHAYSTVWWTCDLQWVDSLLQPKPPFHAYNPFDAYYPADEIKAGKKSLPYVFLAVDWQDHDAVEEFSRRFGLLGSLERSPDIVESHFGESFKSFKGPLEWRTAREPLADGAPEASLIEGLGLNLSGYCSVQEMDIQNFRLGQDRMREVLSWIEELRGGVTPGRGIDLRLLLRIRLNCALSGVRPRLDWDDRRASWIIGWDVRSLLSAMYVMLLLDLLGPGKIFSCRQCNQPFLGVRDWSQYCSPRCRNTYKQRGKRQRARNREVRKKLPKKRTTRRD